ncbi:MAG: hypothetical protein QW303_05625 [Nitrososphaerota archaeon]
MSFFPKMSQQMGSIGLVTQSIIGIVLFPILTVNSIASSQFIPKEYAGPIFAYVGWLIITLLFASVSSYRKSQVADKKCHYCGGALEVSKLKCKSPLCGKEQ